MKDVVFIVGTLFVIPPVIAAIAVTLVWFIV
jgi:hypothetical protein